MVTRRSSVLLLVAALAGSGVTARLGLWQWDRAAEKRAWHSAIEQRQSLPPLPAEALARDEAGLASQLHRRVEAFGRWDERHTVFLDNRTMNGQAGFIVVTPLVLPDGDAVLVQRGFRPRNAADRTDVKAPVLETGEVRLPARIAAPPSRLMDFGQAGSGAIRQNLDLDTFSAEIGRPLRPMSLLQTAAVAGDDGLRRDWPGPVVDVAKHLGYAFQWFALSALIAGLYVWFRILRPRIRRTR